MEDLTTGPLTRHLLKTTSFMLVTMIFQTLYFLIDLYWVGRLGTHAVAAVAIAGNFTFIVLALTQMLGVGTTTVVSHAVGRKNREDAQLMFNQAQVLAVVTGIAFLIVGMLVRLPYTRAMSADTEPAALAAQYACRFRVRHDGSVPGGRLRHRATVWRRGAGRLWNRTARDSGPVHARCRARFFSCTGRGTEFRRTQSRTRRRHVSQSGVYGLRGHG